MEIKKPIVPAALLLVLAAGITFYLYFVFNINSFSIRDHSFHPSLFFLTAVTLVSFLLLILLWQLWSKIENIFFSLNQKKIHTLNLINLIPLGIFLFSPLLFSRYTTSSDLSIRMVWLAVFTGMTLLFLKISQPHIRSRIKSYADKMITRFSHLSTKKKLLILFTAAFLIYNLATLCMVYHGFAFTGDEPYYLLTTHSLYADQDINVLNNYKNNDHFNFYPREIYPNLRLRAYARFGKEGQEKAYPISQPGISFLMLPFYWFSRLFEGRALIFILKGSLSIWAVLLGLQVFLFAQEHFKQEKISLLLWGIYSFTSPILFYAIHLYPEVSIALFSLFIFRKIRSSQPLRIPHYLFLGFLLSLYAWFGLKYNMIFWTLMLVCIYLLLKNHKAGWKISYFLFFPLLSLGLNYYYIYALYGTLNPIAIYEGVLTPESIEAFKEVMWKTPLNLRIDSFLDYFLDQRDGLLLYSPIYFFSLLGLVELFRRSKKDFIFLSLIPLPYIFNYAFFAHRQGGCPQGRVLTSISWIGIILVGYFLISNKKKIYSILFGFSAVAALILTVLLLNDPSHLYQPTTHEYTFRAGGLFLSLSTLDFYLPGILPSFVKINNLKYIPNYVWLGLIILFIVFYIKKRSFKLPRNYSFKVICASVFLIILSLWFTASPHLVLYMPRKAEYSPAKKVGFYSLERHSIMRNPGEFYLHKDNYEYTFNFTSFRPIKNLILSFGETEGVFDVEIYGFDEKVYQGKTSKGFETFDYADPPNYPYKQSYLYQIRFKIRKITGEPLTKVPYFLSIYPEF